MDSGWHRSVKWAGLLYLAAWMTGWSSVSHSIANSTSLHFEAPAKTEHD